MSIIDPIIMELKEEAAKTRQYLEIIPEDKFDWKPHVKSMSLIQLGSHLVEILEWTIPTLDLDELSFNMEDYKPWIARSINEMLEKFDSNLATMLGKMDGKSDEEMMKIWRMKVNGQVVLELPRVTVVRAMVLNHSVHHRGQLSVYLRLNDVHLPPLYGPTADEQKV